MKVNVDDPVFTVQMRNPFHYSLFARGTQIQGNTCSISRPPFLSAIFDERKSREGFRLMSYTVVGSSDCRKTMKLCPNSNKKCVHVVGFFFQNKDFFKDFHFSNAGLKS